MPDNLTTKECTKCGKSYPATTEYFTPAGEKRSGLHSWCRNCTRAGNRESQKMVDRETKKRRQKEHYERNREYYREYRRKTAKAKREYNREYYKKNQRVIIEKQRERDGSIKMDEDNYADLVPITDRDTFREWAVITSGEYGYILQKGVDSVAGRDVE